MPLTNESCSSYKAQTINIHTHTCHCTEKWWSNSPQKTDELGCGRVRCIPWWRTGDIRGYTLEPDQNKTHQHLSLTLLFTDWLQSTDLFSCIAASLFNKLTYLQSIITAAIVILGWLGSRVVSMLDSGTEGPGFKSQQVQANCSHPLCLCSPSSKTGSSPLKGCKGNCRPGGK